MRFSYRTRRILKNIGVIALVIAVLSAVVYLCWFTWLERYVIYTRDQGAVLDRNLSPHVPEGPVAVAPEKETVSIYYNEGENAINTSRELTQMVGYYADAKQLEDMQMVLTQVELLSAGSPLMLDVKDAKGNFYYSSALSGSRRSGIDPTAVDALIEKMDKKGVYLIARLPAFRDYAFGLSHTENGLFVSSGAYLWADEDYCYWLDPTKQGTITHLVDIVNELKGLGFDEVVFENFCFPPAQNLKFSEDRTQAINAAATTLVTALADQNFAVSFVSTPGFVTPGGRSRVYLTDAVAAQAAATAEQTGVADPAAQAVFLTENHDTRFNEYSVLRPLDSAG